MNRGKLHHWWVLRHYLLDLWDETKLSMVPMLLLLLLMEIGLGLEIMIAVELLRVVHVVDWVRVEGDLVLLRLLLRMDRCKHNAEESRDIVFNVAVQRQRNCFQHRQDSFLEYLALL